MVIKIKRLKMGYFDFYNILGRLGRTKKHEKSLKKREK